MIYRMLKNSERFICLLKGLVLKILLKDKDIFIGNKFQTHSIVVFTLKKNCNLKIGNNVVFGKNIDLRIYDHSTLIIEDNCKIDDGVRIIAANGNIVHIRNNTKIGFYSVINGGGSIEIGPETSTYGFVYIQSSTHSQNKDGGFEKSKYSHSKVKIGKNVLIGPHSVILPGSQINDNTVISAHTIRSNSEK